MGRMERVASALSLSDLRGITGKEVAVYHREPRLALCDELKGWKEGRGERLWRQGTVYNYGCLELYGRNNTPW